jgi:predicted O-methyltransferase YrrM
VNAFTHLVRLFVRATSCKRVLEIGTGDAATTSAIAESLPRDGVIITLERDREMAARARVRLAQQGYADLASVMIGEAARFLHKIAGPFDMVVQNAERSQYASLHDRLVTLLAPGGLLITNNVTRDGGGYNEVLAADRRLATTFMNVGDGIAVSVRTTNAPSGDSDR